MIFLQFIILGAIVVIGAIKLASQAEVIEQNSKMNAAVIGIIIALTTSLPELATGLTSTFIGQPQMAIGNILGSNAFNFLILALFNIMFFSKVVLGRVDKGATRLNIFSGIMYVLFLVAFFSTKNNSNIEILGRFTLTSIGIFVTYILAIRVTSSIEDEPEEELIVDGTAYRKAKVNFVALAIIILTASVYLAKSADMIVAVTGLNASIVGAIFIGISTSLPELVTCYSLCKNGSYTMAATSIWGSNLFNFAILTILDIFSNQPLLTQIDDDLVGLAMMGLVFAFIHYIQANIGSKHKIINVIPSIGMIAAYLLFFIF
ncbi:hypothetical protein RZE82_00215 [Mollicutes bacterium LVI A0039]|nr:hypothetical protein RZE82_00215 [Mollicutes bacterium LVI A0039]